MAAQKSEAIVRDLLELAGVEINGKNPWDIQVHNPALYDRVLQESSLGLGESYMDGWWEVADLTEFISRLIQVDAVVTKLASPSLSAKAI